MVFILSVDLVPVNCTVMKLYLFLCKLLIKTSINQSAMWITLVSLAYTHTHTHTHTLAVYYSHTFFFLFSKGTVVGGKKEDYTKTWGSTNDFSLSIFVLNIEDRQHWQYIIHNGHNHNIPYMRHNLTIQQDTKTQITSKSNFFF